MKIRRARPQDVDAVVELGIEFYQQTKYLEDGITLDVSVLRATIEHLLEHGIVQVAEVDGEVIAFMMVVIVPFFFNYNYFMGTELAFYVSRSHRKSSAGKRLLKQVENVARQKNLKYLNMVSLEKVNPEAADSLYVQEGYVKCESVYTKELR